MAVVAGGWHVVAGCACLSSANPCVSMGGPWLALCCWMIEPTGVRVQRDGKVGAHACSSLPLHHMWLTYFSSEQQRRGENWEGYKAKSQADRSPLVSGAGRVIP